MNPEVERALNLARDQLTVADAHFHKELHKGDCRELIRECAVLIERLSDRVANPSSRCRLCGVMTDAGDICWDCQDDWRPLFAAAKERW